MLLEVEPDKSSLDNQEIKDIINHDLSQSRQYHDSHIGKIQEWLDEYNGEPYGNEVDGRSKIVWKLIKKQGESLISNIIKPFQTNYDILELAPVTEADVYKSKIDEKLVNHYWNKEFNPTRFLKQLGKVVVPEGTAFIRVGWTRKTKVREQTVPTASVTEEMIESFSARGAEFINNGEMTIIRVETVLKNHPTAKVVRNSDVFIDPTADSFEESKFLIYELRTSLSDIKSNPLYDEEAVKKLEAVLDENDDQKTDGLDPHGYNETEFKFSDKARKKITLYEYWGEYDIDGDNHTEPVVATMAKYGHENIILRMEKNPFPFKKIPFVSIPLYEEPFKIYGTSLSGIISDEQKLSTAVVRGIIDNMANSNNGIKFFKKNALDAINFNRLKNGEKYIEINTHDNINTAVMDGNFNQLPQHIFGMLQMLDGQAEALTGISRAMQGLPGSEIKASSSNFSAMMSQAQLRLLDVTNNITNGLKQVLYMWITMAMEYVDDAEIKKITGIDIPMLKQKETERLFNQFGLNELPQDVAQRAMDFVRQEVEDMFDRDDVKFDIKMKVGTDGLKQIKIANLNMLMQQLAPLAQAGRVPPDAIKLLVADLAEQLDRPDIAQMITEYQPQPDPLQQAMAEAEVKKKQAEAAKDAALAKNAEARSQEVLAKVGRDNSNHDADQANKYADVATKMANIDQNDIKVRSEAEAKLIQANKPQGANTKQ